MPPFNYKTEANRYKYYYQRLRVLYRKPSIQVSTAVLFTLITIIFFAAFAIRPTLQTIATLIKTIENQKQVLSQAQKKAAALATAQQQFAALATDLPILNSAIPENDQIQTLLKQVEAIASQYGIPLDNLRIDKIEYPPSTESSDVQKISFSIGFSAPYPIAKSFLETLSMGPRYMVINSVTMSTPQKKGQTESNMIEVQANCVTFFVKTSGEAYEVSQR